MPKTKMFPVASYDGDGYTNNIEKLVEMAREAGLRNSQFEVKRADKDGPMSNYDHRMTLYVTEAGKRKWEQEVGVYGA